MQLFKEDGGIDMYLTAMQLGWSQVASSSSLRIDMWSLECVALLHGLAPLILQLLIYCKVRYSKSDWNLHDHPIQVREYMQKTLDLV